MSDRVQVQKKAKSTAAQGPARAVQQPVIVSKQAVAQPGITTQLESAARLGHSMTDSNVSGPAPTQVQRQVDRVDEDKNKPRVGPEGGPVPPAIESEIQRARGGGQQLDSAIRAQMGEKLGHDFSSVRVHTDTQADALNHQLSARAFTTGNDIFFQQGMYDPFLESGRELLAHELTHVVQQSSGQVNGAEGRLTVRPTGDTFEQEADRGSGVSTRLLPATSSPLQRGKEDEKKRAQQAAQSAGPGSGPGAGLIAAVGGQRAVLRPVAHGTSPASRATGAAGGATAQTAVGLVPPRAQVGAGVAPASSPTAVGAMAGRTLSAQPIVRTRPVVSQADEAGSNGGVVSGRLVARGSARSPAPLIAAGRAAGGAGAAGVRSPGPHQLTGTDQAYALEAFRRVGYPIGFSIPFPEAPPPRPRHVVEAERSRVREQERMSQPDITDLISELSLDE